MIGNVCACGARYESFRSGHTFAEVREMLRVGSDDPELWLNRSRPAVLRFWAQLKRDLWEVTHGYCARVLEENGPNLVVTCERCDCDHCNPDRWRHAIVTDNNTDRRTA
jgi:hypothetical protein